MKNKGNQSMVVLLCVLGTVVLITATLTGVFVYSSSSKTDDAVLAEDSTALKHECEYELEFYNHPLDYILHIEEVTGYDLTPDLNVEGEISINLSALDENIDFVDLSDEKLDPDAICEYLCHLEYDKLPDKYIRHIENQIANDNNFIESLGDLKIITDSVGGDNTYEYKMVYIMDTGEFNTMPDEAGEYHIITIYYDMDSHDFSIREFLNKYWALEKSAK